MSENSKGWDEEKILTMPEYYWPAVIDVASTGEAAREPARNCIEIRSAESRDILVYIVNGQLSLDGRDDTGRLEVRHPFAKDFEGHSARFLIFEMASIHLQSFVQDIYTFSAWITSARWYVENSPFDGIERLDASESYRNVTPTGANYGFPYLPNKNVWAQNHLPLRVEMSIEYGAGEHFDTWAREDLPAHIEKSKAERRAKAEAAKAEREERNEKVRLRVFEKATAAGLITTCTNCGQQIMGEAIDHGRRKGEILWDHVETGLHTCPGQRRPPVPEFVPTMAEPVGRFITPEFAPK